MRGDDLEGGRPKESEQQPRLPETKWCGDEMSDSRNGGIMKWRREEREERKDRGSVWARARQHLVGIIQSRMGRR